MAKILIVDDEAPLLKLYSTVLLNEGHQVLTAATAQRGYDLAVSDQPDLVLLDVMMPGADGVEMFSRLSEDPATQAMRVIFLTSLVQEEEVAKGRGRIGGRAYISKSTPLPKFVTSVHAALSGVLSEAGMD